MYIINKIKLNRQRNGCYSNALNYVRFHYLLVHLKNPVLWVYVTKSVTVPWMSVKETWNVNEVSSQDAYIQDVCECDTLVGLRCFWNVNELLMRRRFCASQRLMYGYNGSLSSSFYPNLTRAWGITSSFSTEKHETLFESILISTRFRRLIFEDSYSICICVYRWFYWVNININT